MSGRLSYIDDLFFLRQPIAQTHADIQIKFSKIYLACNILNQDKTFENIACHEWPCWLTHFPMADVTFDFAKFD